MKAFDDCSCWQRRLTPEVFNLVFHFLLNKCRSFKLSPLFNRSRVVDWRGRAYKQHQICHLSKTERAPFMFTRAQPTIPHSPPKPAISLVFPLPIPHYQPKKKQLICLSVWGDMKQRKKRWWVWLKGRLSAFVGQRKCLMLYADELTFNLLLGKLRFERRQSLPPLAQTRFPHLQW